jgi:lysophospholipase L1-like esterase
LLSKQFRYVIIWGGVNDLANGVSENTIESNLQAMYTQAHNAGAKVISINITPWKGDTMASWSDAAQTAQNDVNSWIANTAINIDYKVDAYSVLVDPNNAYTLLPAYDDGSHIHLSSAGYAVVANAVFAAVAIW